MMSRTLEEITEQIQADVRNQEFTARGVPPIYQIHAAAKVLIIGQAPGRKVTETLIPFNDQSGDTLIRWMGIDRSVFYSDKIAIMPMDFYYPGKGRSGDLPPREFVAREYHPALLSLMPELRLTLLVGKYAVDYYLKERRQRNLTETVRNYEAYLPAFFPLVHPSPLNFRWQGKNPWFQQEVVPVLQEKVKEALRQTESSEDAE